MYVCVNINAVLIHVESFNDRVGGAEQEVNIIMNSNENSEKVSMGTCLCFVLGGFGREWQ